jgi:putative nucleotidyltransferase with HDIG domain
MLIDRAEALEMLEKNLGNINLIRHCLASEAVLRALAENRGEDPDLWGITGLLHDIDYELTSDVPETHGMVAAEILADYLPYESIHAIQSHNAENTGVERSSDFDYLLAAGESITGLVVAVALVYPDKKLASVKPKSILKRMNMSAFARSVPRDTIRECSKAGYDLDVFTALALNAMKAIAEDIGL